jgi:FixJ family two-component response regulator
MSMEKPIVFVVDDDESVCKALKRLMKSVGIKVRTLASAEDFLNQGCHNVPGCLILDVRMPGINGLELQEKLVESSSTMPIIFISAHEDVSVREQGLRAGAVAFLQKPFEDKTLLDAVYSAFGRLVDDKVPPES